MSSPTRGKRFAEYYSNPISGFGLCDGGWSSVDEYDPAEYGYSWLIRGHSMSDWEGPGDRTSHIVLFVRDTEQEQVLDFWGNG